MQFQALGFSILAILVVSLIPALLFLAFFSSQQQESLDGKVNLVAAAIGALLGNVIFHLLPEALGIPGENYPTGTLCMLLTGILTFLFGEQLLQQYHHGHGHTHFESIDDDDLPSQPHHHHHHLPVHFGALLVSSDLLHSFVDGIAIGAAFLSSKVMGLSTALAVLIHEVPHLIGDYAVLLSTGFTKYQLLLYASSVVASSIVGSLMVNILNSAFESQTWGIIERGLLAFAAGNFLYISLADLIPEVLIRKPNGGNPKNRLYIVFVVLGALSMLLLRVAHSE